MTAAIPLIGTLAAVEGDEGGAEYPLRMQGLMDIPPEVASLVAQISGRLERVSKVFDDHLVSDLPPVNQLCSHIERYRGKMLRPTLVLACGMAAGRVTREHDVLAAVCEMVHMATLVHDDVLDEADTRRRGATVNRLKGNETAVILGDYLIASAFSLCSTLADQRYSMAVGRASAAMCAGELLQLHRREDFSLDEPTYFEIVERKTAELIACACELGAAAAGLDAGSAAVFAGFGRDLGVAFQIQDDLLDLTGDERVVGKSVGKDLEKGKATLPVIHCLSVADSSLRAKVLMLLAGPGGGRRDSSADGASVRNELVAAMRLTDSINHAQTAAESLVARAKGRLLGVAEGAPKRLLFVMADAAVKRVA